VLDLNKMFLGIKYEFIYVFICCKNKSNLVKMKVSIKVYKESNDVKRKNLILKSALVKFFGQKKKKIVVFSFFET
jgi:hypothetical protein